jgi:hypothetical protein
VCVCVLSYSLPHTVDNLDIFSAKDSPGGGAVAVTCTFVISSAFFFSSSNIFCKNV